MNNKSKKILICPLDWGLGHASRCIPIIESLLLQKYEVVIAADNYPLQLLKATFPTLFFIKFPGFSVRYAAKGSLNVKLFFQLPAFLKSIFKEHITLQKIIDSHQIDFVISDNRYGCWTNKVPSVFITHQLNIQAPFGKKWIQKINYWFINRFSECWIPDVDDEVNLSGKLAHNLTKFPNKFFYIGPLSRFKKNPSENNHTIIYDVMVIISGPEPQRTIFENLMVNELKASIYKSIIIRGLPSETEIPNQLIASNITYFNHLPTTLFLEKINNSELIIARSGYSTIMDLAILGKKAILISTPKQTEQEYLANYHHTMSHFLSIPQHQFKLKKALKEATLFKGIKLKRQMNLDSFLKERIE